MYLSTPEEGFSIPVLYINKAELNINELKDINTIKEDRKINYLKEDKGFRNYRAENINNEDIENRLIFDVDEPINESEEFESVIDRKNKKQAESKANGFLILDGDNIEDK